MRKKTTFGAVAILVLSSAHALFATTITNVSVHLEFNEAGTMYYNTSYTNGTVIHNNSGTVAGTSGLYDNFTPSTLTYRTSSIFGGSTAGSFVAPNPSAWIITDGVGGPVSDLIVFNSQTIFLYDASKDPGDSSSLYVLPATKSEGSPSVAYDLTTVSGLKGYLENIPSASVKIAAANISVFTEKSVTDTDLSGSGYQASGITSGPGAMQFDGTGPTANTTITFISDSVPLPPVVYSGGALLGFVGIMRNRRGARARLI